jgi:hypothetical protein
MVYDRVDADGGPAGLAVGAENDTGTVGDSRFSTPFDYDEFRVHFTPGIPGDVHTIYFEAHGVQVGRFTNCAEMTAGTFDGVAFSCDESEVLP